MAATVADIISRVERGLDRVAVSSGPGGAFLTSDWFMWVKDAYNKIVDLCRIPRATSTIPSVALTAAYTIPTGCWDGIAGIISVTYDGYPVQRGNMAELQDNYGKYWLAPPGETIPRWYIDQDDSTKFTLVPAPPAVKNIVVIYAAEQAAPTATTDAILTVFLPYVDIIPDYVMGCAMELDRQGRGAAKKAEFDGKLLRKFRKKIRNGGRRKGTEAYSLSLSDYRLSFSRGRNV